MCTVSWTPIPGGYSLHFNRDERRTRGPGSPPALLSRGGLAFLTPIDADAGGTWIGVNEAGAAVCLLNRYHETPIDAGGPRTSRGLLVLDLLSTPAAAAAIEALGRRPLAEFQPFTICAVDRDGLVRIADWTGSTLITSTTEAPGLVRTSSGTDQQKAERIRSDTLTRLAHGQRITPTLLDQLHRSHLPERGPFSVCMHRVEAETQSLTTIRVTATEATLDYVPGSPCLDAPPVRVYLPLLA